MHLKSYPKLVRSELRLDVVGVQTSQRSQQQAVLLRTCAGNRSNNRLPFSVLSPNTQHCSAVTNGVGVRSVAALRLPGRENDSLRLYQTATEDGDAPPDIWTVIKPGHVREKIAIFATDDECTGANGRAAPTNHAAMSGLSRAAKAKGSWEENGSAKRRRRSGNDQQRDARKASPRRSDSSSEAVMALATATEEQKVSVVEMVAFLEQRASEPQQQQPDAKPLLAMQRSSASITLSRAPPPEVRGEEPDSIRGEEPESVRREEEEPESNRGEELESIRREEEEPESVRVSDMVARLESACEKRQSAGDLSRNNSLRRIAGRVLLATDQSSAPCPPSSASDREPTGCSETAVSAVANANGSSGEETLDSAAETHTQALPLQQAPPLTQASKVEPMPGLLFLLPASQPRPPAARCDSGSQSEKRRRRKADRAQQEDGDAGVVTLCSSSSSPPPRRASPDFLLMRQRLQQLLAPQPFLAVLPHHVLLTILALLPTQSLAALKCTCRYLRSVIDDYGVRPADSLWVSDPRYRDDPCKQCKKRYGRGDVSLCRWHHKPYCQALPYGPGYWMCCHGARRDTPGCNVGLHDNRWVPAFHSINVPIYRRGRGED
uniref:F-box protein 34 n=1 Tax=Sander lucioperca TaxID=283035 RepID=A0A8D0A7W2_SANLU